MTDAELRGKLDQLWGWAKAGKGQTNYAMAIENVDSFTDDVMQLITARDAVKEREITELIGTAGAHACYCAYSVNNCTCALTDVLRTSDQAKEEE